MLDGMSSQLWQRIRAARTLKGISQQAVADACGGISRNAVSLWETENADKRTEPSWTQLVQLSKLTGAPLEAWLLNDEIDDPLEGWNHLIRHSSVKTVDYEDPGFIWLNKVIGAHLSAGSGEVIWDIDEADKYYAYRRDWFQRKGLRPERCKVWMVRGDSMEEKYSHGDYVVIDMSDREPRHGKIYALVGEGGLRMKQLRRTPSGWEMYSFNPDKNKYPTEPIVDNNFAIIGRIRGHQGDDD
jgi:transcriptional regulator with XRE-family HTH domain